MKPSTHAISSAVAAGAAYAVTSSSEFSLAIFLAGVFIDLDHLLDYVREYGLQPKPVFCYHKFRKTEFRRLVLLLHSWELISGLWLAAVVFGNQLMAGTAAGMTLHLVLDQVGNNVHARTYFLFWRMWNRFETKKIVRHRARSTPD